jgi:endonuclease/exonuclease/phosphatase family metal-dependent hydrolase
MSSRLLAVASYNLHRCVGVDGKSDVERTAAVIRELDSDIIAIQEVDNTPSDDPERHALSMQLDYLTRATGYSSVPGLRIIRHTGEYGNAILTRLPVKAVRRVDLSFGRFEPRGAIDAELDAGVTSLRIIATHFGLLPRERRAQWLKLMTALAETSAHMPTILMGDMNEWLGRARMLREARKVFGESMIPKAFPSFFPLLRLTRIWCRPRQALRSIVAHSSALAKVASDHLPVKAVVEIGEW